MRRSHALALALAGTVGILGAAAPANAQTVVSGVGLQSPNLTQPTSTDTLCPEGETMVGVRGHTGTINGKFVVTGVRAQCRDGRSALVLEAPATAGAAPSLADPVVQCDPGRVATGLYGRGGELVDQIGLSCQDPARTLAATQTGFIGGTGGLEQQASCPAGEVAVGLRFVAGNAFNIQTGDRPGHRIDLLCAVVPDPPCDFSAEPAGCWRFDETSGTVAKDSSGNGNDGTYLGGPTLGVPGIIGLLGTAVALDGVNDVVRVPDSPTLDVGDSFTFEGWVLRSSTTKSHQLVLKGDKGLHLVVTQAAAGSQVLLRKANVTTLARSEAGIPADGLWHQVVVTMDGPGTARIFIDGIDTTVQVVTNQTIQDTALPLYFGGTGTTGFSIDEFGLYDEPYGSDKDL